MGACSVIAGYNLLHIPLFIKEKIRAAALFVQ
jgi:hypothetical protein